VSLSPKTELALLPPNVARDWLARQDDWIIQEILREEWWWTARPEQRSPAGSWFIWLLLAGRGFGKTRTCAEWLYEQIEKYPFDTSGYRTEWLIIAETLTDGLRICVNGPAGIARVLERKLGPPRRTELDKTGRWKVYGGQKPYIQLWMEDNRKGPVVYIEGADDEDVGRGYNASGAWLDEFAKWPKPDGSWNEGIMPSLRAELPNGGTPRVVVATTPKLVVQLIEWQDRRDGSVVITSGSTYENAGNLAPLMLAEFHKRYHGTRLGRQELFGELIREIEGSLWSLDWIERTRVDRDKVPETIFRAVGFDPAGSGVGDLSGLVCAGRGVDGDDYVLGDWSKQVAGNAAARRAWEMFRVYEANLLVIESNFGKRWLYDVVVRAYEEMRDEGLFPPGGAAPIKMVTAKVGKKLRAEPVAARYEQLRVHHVKDQGLQDLETQQISWVPGETKDSPDRVDADVYALLECGERDFRRTDMASPHNRLLEGVGSMGPLAGRLPGA
jgi:phage terminase large subunit-like protein